MYHIIIAPLRVTLGKTQSCGRPFRYPPPKYSDISTQIYYISRHCHIPPPPYFYPTLISKSLPNTIVPWKIHFSCIVVPSSNFTLIKFQHKFVNHQFFRCNFLGHYNIHLGKEINARGYAHQTVIVFYILPLKLVD